MSVGGVLVGDVSWAGHLGCMSIWGVLVGGVSVGACHLSPVSWGCVIGGQEGMGDQLGVCQLGMSVEPCQWGVCQLGHAS